MARKGLPWLNDPMAAQEAEAIAAQQAQEKLESTARQPQPQGAAQDPSDDEDPDTPVVVR